VTKLPKAILPAAILAAAVGLAACQGGEKATAARQGGDKYAGLDGAIRTWHGEIKQADAQCKGRPEGEQCRAFEIACKGEREIAPGEAAEGVSAKVAVAMGWEGWDVARAEYRPATAVAEFQKVGGEWKRLPTGPVNLATCVAS
jgi:hypothetical protein